VIYKRLSPASMYNEDTLEHLHVRRIRIPLFNSFPKDLAADGLRTLCIASAEISEAEYREWNKKFYQASIAIKHRFQH
jgi:hypothetical protein